MRCTIMLAWQALNDDTVPLPKTSSSSSSSCGCLCCDSKTHSSRFVAVVTKSKKNCLHSCLFWAKTDNLPKTSEPSAPIKRSIANLLASIYRKLAHWSKFDNHQRTPNRRTFSTTLAHPDGSGLPGGQHVQPLVSKCLRSKSDLAAWDSPEKWQSNECCWHDWDPVGPHHRLSYTDQVLHWIAAEMLKIIFFCQSHDRHL